MHRRIPIALKIFFGFTVILFFVLIGNLVFLSQLTKLDNVIRSTSSGMYRVALSQQLRGKLRQQRSSRALYNHFGGSADRSKTEATLRQFGQIATEEIKKARKSKGERSALDSLSVEIPRFIEISRRATRLAEDSSATAANALISSNETKALINSIRANLLEAGKKHNIDLGTNDLAKLLESIDLYIKPLFYIERFSLENRDFLAGAESLAVLSRPSNPVPGLIASLSQELDSLFRREIETGEVNSHIWDSVYSALNDTLENILVTELSALGVTLEQSHRAVSITRQLDTWGTLILLVFGLLIAYWIANKIASPIGKLRVATNSASRGEWDKRIERSTNDEIGDLTDDFNTMLVELGKLDEMKSRFLASITHDLKSPIGRVRGNIANLQDGLLGPVSGGQAELLNMMARDVDKLSRLIHDILDLQKIKAGAFKLDITKVNVKKFILDSLEQHATVFLEKGIVMGVKIGFDELEAQFDQRQIDRVLDNLITNALKYTTNGDKIIIDAYTEERNLIVKVFDTGIGIPKEHIDKVFGEFYQVEGKTKAAKGTGLGLAISKQIIEAHSGRIWADSLPGSGTCFAFSIPICNGGMRFE